MGIFWSTRHDFYIHEFENPRVQRLDRNVMLHLSTDDSGVLVCKDGTVNPFSDFVSDDSRQQAVVLYVRLKSVSNEFEESIQLCLNNLFTDNTIKVPCPAKCSLVVKENDQLLYRNTELCDNDVLLYAGLDDIMLNGQNSEELYEVFPADHPFVSYIKLSGPIDTEHVTMKTNQDGNRVFYLITKTYAAEKRKKLSENVFKYIHYTRFDDCTISCPQVNEQSSLFITLNIEYILVNTGIPSLRQKTEQIK